MNKTVLLAGTNSKSIGRHVGKALNAQGWDVWLYGRHAKRVEKERWHERACDISQEGEVSALLQEMPAPEAVVYLADGDGHGELTDLTGDQISRTVNAKLTGSVILAKNIFTRSSPASKIKMIWCAGKVSEKPKDIILYGLINSGLLSFVKELNRHYKENIEAYYLSTGVVRDTTLGDKYLSANPQHLKSAETPQQIAGRIEKIIAGQVQPGMVMPGNQNPV